ncbi:thioredoxin family protein [Burkholderia territorii]|uniref:thioredoxin family protein n=1 Tax=Burkholderia territorii TaxID=1503055 RepID=UPI0009BD3FC4|nr:thioredoxin domain-containing protein [Burkholderia territorii]
MAIEATTEATFEADIQGECPVLVDFWAPWCGPCRALAPHLERLAADYAGRLKVLKLNVDEARDVWKRVGARGIPTLVLYAKGTEYNRVLGPSTMRMRVMVEKWLGELGLDAAVPGGVSAAPQAEPAADASAHPRVWHSFGGDPELKAQCVARLWDGLHERRFVPSELLAGGKDQFEAVVGAPAQLGALIGTLLMMNSGEDPHETEHSRAQVCAMAETLPVGVDLHAVSTGVLFDLVYGSEWNIMQSLDAVAGRELITRIQALHVREISGESIPSADWQALQRAAVILGGHEDSDDMSRTLETLATPLAEWNAGRTVWRVIKQATTDYRRYPDWSRDEAKRIDAMERENLELAGNLVEKETGAIPEEPGAARDAWIEVVDKRYETLIQQCRVAHPTLWARYDAWRAHKQQIEKQVPAYLAENLLARLRASAAQGA